MYDQENQPIRATSNTRPCRRPLAELNSNQGPQTSTTRNLTKLEECPTRCREGKNTKDRDNPLVSKRNERERNRVRLLNLGFDRLRSVVPSHTGEQLSKISTLKKAIWYIEHLDRVLHGQKQTNQGISSGPPGRRRTMTHQQATEAPVLKSVRLDLGQTRQAGNPMLGKASWSSFTPSSETGTKPSEGRTVTEKMPSPIFPTPLGINESAYFGLLQPSPSTSYQPTAEDSGYKSLHDSSQNESGLYLPDKYYTTLPPSPIVNKGLHPVLYLTPTQYNKSGPMLFRSDRDTR